jgi:hypothetical protein
MNFIGGGFLASESQYTLATSWSFHSGLGAAVLYESAPEDEVPVGFGTHDKVTLRHPHRCIRVGSSRSLPPLPLSGPTLLKSVTYWNQ